MGHKAVLRLKLQQHPNNIENHINVLTPEDPSGAPTERREFIVSTYQHLIAALLAFVLLSTVLMVSGISEAAAKWMMNTANLFHWLGLVGVFLFASWLATYLAVKAQRPQTQVMGLGFYVLAEGFIFAPLFGIAHLELPGSIGAAGFMTLLMVGGLTWTAFTSKSTFSMLGGILKVGTLVAFGTIAVGLIFGFSLGIWFSGIMVLFAGACVLYDTSRIIHDYPTDRPAGAALHLFASITMLLWFTLRTLHTIATLGSD